MLVTVTVTPGSTRALVVLDRAFDRAVDGRRLRERRGAEGETQEERRENAKHGGNPSKVKAVVQSSSI